MDDPGGPSRVTLWHGATGYLTGLQRQGAEQGSVSLTPEFLMQL